MRLAINNLDEDAPTITSGATATAIDENSGAGQVVYTATATDTADVSARVTLQPGRRRCGAVQHRRRHRRGDADRQSELRGEVELQLHVMATERRAIRRRRRSAGDQQPGRGCADDHVGRDGGGDRREQRRRPGGLHARRRPTPTDSPSDAVTYSLGGADAARSASTRAAAK